MFPLHTVRITARRVTLICSILATLVLSAETASAQLDPLAQWNNSAIVEADGIKTRLTAENSRFVQVQYSGHGELALWCEQPFSESVQTAFRDQKSRNLYLSRIDDPVRLSHDVFRIPERTPPAIFGGNY